MQVVVDFLNQIANWIGSIPGEVWVTLLGGLPVALSGQIVKAVRKIKKSGKMVLVVTAVSAIYSLVLYLIDSNPNHPWVIAIQTSAVYLAAQPFYFIMVKPAWKWLSEQLALAAAYRAELLSAAEPATGVPAEGEAPPARALDVQVQDFGK